MIEDDPLNPRALPVANGQQLQEIDHFPDGGSKVPAHTVERAGILGAIRLLEEIAVRDDNQRYRREAKHCASELKRLVRKRVSGDVISDAEFLGNLLDTVRKERQQLPRAPELLTIENGSDS